MIKYRFSSPVQMDSGSVFLRINVNSLLSSLLMSTALTLLIKSPPSEPLRKFKQKSEQNKRLKRSQVSLNGQVFLTKGEYYSFVYYKV